MARVHQDQVIEEKYRNFLEEHLASPEVDEGYDLSGSIYFPKLFQNSSKGKAIEWLISLTVNEKGIPMIVRNSGYVGGKIKEKLKLVKKGTNVGKSNERNPAEQARFVATKMWIDKVMDNHVLSIAELEDPLNFFYPMSAKSYNKKSEANKVVFPVILQAKLNGVRAYSIRKGFDHYKGHPDIMSRDRENYEAVSHIQTACDAIFRMEVNPDGEIYKHGMELQDINSLVKKYHKGETEKLEYWVYDVAMPGMTFTERYNLLASMVPNNSLTIKLVPCIVCNSHEEIKAVHQKFIADGFEGSMIRNPEGMYEFNSRPSCLLKNKDFIDSEFTIVGYEYEEYDDNGTMKRLVIWKCETPDGKRTFNVVPKGTNEMREKYYHNAEEYIGMPLTVRYPELSKEGVPIGNPVGITVRLCA